MKNKALTVLGIAGTALLVAAPAFADTTMTTMSDMSGMTGMNTSIMVNANLSLGSRGDMVTNLQAYLVAKGYLSMPAGVQMGYYGSLTRGAVMKYQQSEGISATGYFGPLTRASFMQKMAMMSGSTNTQAGVMVGGAMMTPNKDIVQNAVSANNVTTVVAAVKAAGLVATLESAGPFTVFAPTNAAFAKLPAGTVDTLLKPENKGTLVDILTYHVVAGRYTSADLTNGLTLKTVEGKTLVFTRDANGKLWINGTAMVETADVISSNGVTHVIDSVLMPQ